MSQDNLSNRIWDAKNAEGSQYLSESEQIALYSLLAKGTRQKTRERLARRVELPLAMWKSYGIYSRVTFVDGDVDYICGQSWTDEMRTLRECVLDI
jgi:hypothetical protein